MAAGALLTIVRRSGQREDGGLAIIVIFFGHQGKKNNSPFLPLGPYSTYVPIYVVRAK